MGGGCAGMGAHTVASSIVGSCDLAGRSSRGLVTVRQSSGTRAEERGVASPAPSPARTRDDVIVDPRMTSRTHSMTATMNTLYVMMPRHQLAEVPSFFGPASSRCGLMLAFIRVVSLHISLCCSIGFL